MREIVIDELLELCHASRAAPQRTPVWMCALEHLLTIMIARRGYCKSAFDYPHWGLRGPPKFEQAEEGVEYGRAVWHGCGGIREYNSGRVHCKV